MVYFSFRLDHSLTERTSHFSYDITMLNGLGFSNESVIITSFPFSRIAAEGKLNVSIEVVTPIFLYRPSTSRNHILSLFILRFS